MPRFLERLIVNRLGIWRRNADNTTSKLALVEQASCSRSSGFTHGNFIFTLFPKLDRLDNAFELFHKTWIGSLGKDSSQCNFRKPWQNRF